MGLEEVSETIDLISSKCHLELWKPNMKDASSSGKEPYMKTNGKKRTFALLMCVMMIVSSMSVWAGYDSETIGGATHDDQALCELYLSSSKGQAFTTPYSNLLSVTTSITVKNSSNVNSYASGTSVATISKSNLIAAYSYHQAGPYSTSLTI